MDAAILQANDLHKTFEDVHAVQGVSFEIRRGEIFSLLGPNGAGKTTTISMLSCLLTPTRGDASIDGYSVLRDASAVKRIIGVVPQEIALYPTLSARENLAFWGKMYGLDGEHLKDRIEVVLEVVGPSPGQRWKTPGLNPKRCREPYKWCMPSGTNPDALFHTLLGHKDRCFALVCRPNVRSA